MPPADLLLSDRVKAEARRLGFAACGLARAERVAPWREDEQRRFVAEGRHAGMDYLARHLELRLDPTLLLPGARTVVSVALSYYDPRPFAPDALRLARYALGSDYHDVVRGLLHALREAVCPDAEARICCDTAPVDERYWAMRAGVGFTGRSGQLIVRGAGTYHFLGELIVCREADRYDAPCEHVGCGACRRCLDACPTGALGPDGIDARRCLSYLTIENRGEIPAPFRSALGACIYGCDRCAEVCPHNRHARPTPVEALRARPELLARTAQDWLALDVETYRRLFKGSAVKRAKYEGLVRNIRAATT